MKVKSSSKIKSKHYYKNVEYITDIKGKKLKVIMPIASYDEMLEDLHDLSVIAERKKDSVVSMLKVYNELKKNGFI